MDEKKQLKIGFQIKYKIAECGNGKGIFTEQDIKKGELVFVQKPGDNLRFIENEKSLRTILKDEFTNDMDRKKFLERTFGYKEKIYQNLDDGEFTNHSDEPNIRLETFDTYVAIRDIRKGEEILEDYHHSFENPDWLIKLVIEYGVDPDFF